LLEGSALSSSRLLSSGQSRDGHMRRGVGSFSENSSNGERGCVFLWFAASPASHIPCPCTATRIEGLAKVPFVHSRYKVGKTRKFSAVVIGFYFCQHSSTWCFGNSL
jgi:hypothetical protein